MRRACGRACTRARGGHALLQPRRCRCQQRLCRNCVACAGVLLWSCPIYKFVARAYARCTRPSECACVRAVHALQRLRRSRCQLRLFQSGRDVFAEAPPEPLLGSGKHNWGLFRVPNSPDTHKGVPRHVGWTLYRRGACRSMRVREMQGVLVMYKIHWSLDM